MYKPGNYQSNKLVCFSALNNYMKSNTCSKEKKIFDTINIKFTVV